jgi:RimJ/RimL family protein N-acetyltransferase
MKIETARLTLEPISMSLAQRIVERDERSGDNWHPDYPLVDELNPLRSLAQATKPDSVFTLYLIRRNADGLAVGGLGFFGPPDASGRIEFGYGLISNARGVGLATEALQAALEYATTHGALRAAADTDENNTASQRVLIKAGLTETHRERSSIYFERDLTNR